MNVETLGRMQDVLLQSKINLLVARGWKVDTTNLAGQELWNREIDGRTYLVELDTALSIEHAIDLRACRCDDEPSSLCPMHPTEDGA